MIELMYLKELILIEQRRHTGALFAIIITFLEKFYVSAERM